MIMNEKQQSLGSCTNAGALEDECYADDSEAGENSVNVLPINDAFCTTCYNLKAIMSKELRISTYAKTADAGCNFCFIIYKTALNFQNRWDQTDPYTVWMNLSSEEGENVTSPLMMCMLLQPPISGRRDIGYGRMNNLEIFITPGDNCPLNNIGPGTVVAKDLQSSIPTATEWLRRCDTSHEKCRPARPARLPHRVIDVGELGLRDSLEADPVLYESHGEEAKYIALSHCWGKAPIIRTTLNTVSSRLKRIKWDSLSKTFQDAIIITRLLCIRYLWIDSLCIIQDDPNDWRQEAALMASIYGESYLTISASNSTNGSGGCRCTPWPTFEVGEALNPAENLPFSIYARERLDHGRFKYWAKPPNPGMETDAFDDYPLMARAWCFQERLLPCRVLHFTSQELFFECKTNDCCECLNFEPRPFAQEEKPLKRFFYEILERKNTEELLNEWTQILEAYSHMDRTQDGDILVALAGIARVIGEAGLHGYFAGMWKENLAFALDWKPKIEKNKVFRHRRPTLYTAPSFSWASVIGPVQWNHDQTWAVNVVKQFCPEFLEMSSTPIGTDPFGGLSAAFLKVKAPLASASIYSTDKDGISNPKLTIQGFQDPNVGTSKYDFERKKLHFDIPGACCDAIASSCIYLMQTKVEVNQIDDKESKSNAMILKRRTDGKYERIGVAENLRVGIFKEHYGPWTEIILV